MTKHNTPKYIEEFWSIVDWGAISPRAKKKINDWLTSTIEAEKKKVVEKYLWKLCHMVEKRIRTSYEIEGFRPIDPTDVCNMVTKLLSKLK